MMLRKEEKKNEAESFYCMAQKWFEAVCPTVKESTALKYHNLLCQYAIPILGDLPVSSVDAFCVQQFCLNLLKSGGMSQSGLSEKTVSDVLSLIRRILNYAKTREGCIVSDLASVHVHRTPKRMRVFTMQEQRRLTGYLCTNENPKNLAILISLYMGLRIGEVCALRWEDISFSERTLLVRQTMQRVQILNDDPVVKKTKILIDTPKSFSSLREIPFPEALYLITCSYYRGNSGFIMPGTTKDFVEPRTLENHFKRVLEELSISYANYHTLRHTFATRCVEQGFDVKSLSEILGHSSVGITMNRYVHPSLESKRKNMRKLTEILSAR